MEGDEVLSGSEAGEELHERYDDTQGWPIRFIMIYMRYLGTILEW